MSEKNYWVRSGSYAILQRLSVFLFGFGSYFFMVRYYSKETFGIWALFVVITSIVEMSRSAFIQNAYVRFFSQPETDHGKLFMASMILNLASTLFFIVVMIGLIPVLQDFWHTSEMAGLIFWYCLTSLILVPFTQLNYLEQANKSFQGVFWSSTIRQGVFFITVIVCSIFFPGLPLMFFAAVQSVCAILGLIVSWRMSGRFLPANRVVDSAIVAKLFRFGRYILGTGIASTMGKNADQIMLGGVSHGTVALYNAGVRILNFIEIPTLSISNIAYPKIAERVNREGRPAAAEMYEKTVASMVGIILPVVIAIVLFPKLILLVTAGSQYLDAAPVLTMMAAAGVLYPFNVQVGSVFEITGKPHISFYINMGSNIMNVLLNIILIQRYGAVGAAWSMIITTTTIFIVSQILLRRQIGVDLGRCLARLIEFYPMAAREAYRYILRKKVNA